MSAQTEDVRVFRVLIRDLRHMSARAASDLADWLVYLELEGKADRTLYAYARQLAALLREYPEKRLGEFTAEDINYVLTVTPKRSRHIVRSIYNQFFLWAEVQGRVDRTPMVRVARVKHPDHRTRDIFSLSDVAQLEALPSPHGHLFAILFGSGIRKAEARNLRRDAIDLDKRRLIVHHGKGGKDRVVAMLPSALQAVADLDLTEGLRREDYLWHTHPGGGAYVSRRWPMGDSTFSRWYANQIEAAGVLYRSPHTTRHTFHELCRLAGLNLEERQALMGHASIRTTADIYGHLDFDTVADNEALADPRAVSFRRALRVEETPRPFDRGAGGNPRAVPSQGSRRAVLRECFDGALELGPSHALQSRRARVHLEHLEHGDVRHASGACDLTQAVSVGLGSLERRTVLVHDGSAPSSGALHAGQARHLGGERHGAVCADEVDDGVVSDSCSLLGVQVAERGSVAVPRRPSFALERRAVEVKEPVLRRVAEVAVGHAFAVRLLGLLCNGHAGNLAYLERVVKGRVDAHSPARTLTERGAAHGDPGTASVNDGAGDENVLVYAVGQPRSVSVRLGVAGEAQ